MRFDDDQWEVERVKRARWSEYKKQKRVAEGRIYRKLKLDDQSFKHFTMVREVAVCRAAKVNRAKFNRAQSIAKANGNPLPKDNRRRTRQTIEAANDLGGKVLRSNKRCSE